MLEQLLSLSTLVFCLAIFALVWVQRKGVETFLPKFATTKAWKEFFMPVGPLGTGALLAALVQTYPYPEMFLNTTWYDRAIFGIACGLLSGLVYRIVKKNVVEKISSSINAPPQS